MGESIGGTDDESLERVAPIEAGAARSAGVGGQWPFGKVVGPVLLGPDDFAVLAAFVSLVDVT